MVLLPFGTEGGCIATKADPALLKALARSFRYQKLLDDGRYASIGKMAAAEKIERRYLGTLLRLKLLALDMEEAILNGRQPDGVTLPALLEGVPVGWGLCFAFRCRGDGTRCCVLRIRSIGIGSPQGRGGAGGQ